MYDTYLYHHGIKGQKWGIRRFQNTDGSYTAIGKKRRNGVKSYKRLKNASHKVNTARKPFNAIANAGVTTVRGVKSIVQKVLNSGKSSGQLSPLGREIAFDAVATVSVLSITKLASVGVNAALKKIDSKELTNTLYNNREFKDISDIPKIEGKPTTKELLNGVNPNFKKSVGARNNCVLCTATMAMREKGYNVAACESKNGHYSEMYFSTAFTPKTKPTKVKFKNISQYESSLSDGSYGDVTVEWRFGGGHSMFWKKENGKINIYDGQSGEVLKPTDPRLVSNVRGKLSFTRLDDKEPTKYVLGIVKGVNKDGTKQSRKNS